MVCMSLRTLYARVGEDAHAWVASQAASTNLSQSDIVNLIITEAMRLGWEIRRGPAARVEHPRESPAVVVPAPVPRDQGQVPGRPPQPGPGPHGRSA